MGWDGGVWGVRSGASLEPAPLPGQLLFCRDVVNKEMSGVVILDTDNDGRNYILTFGREMDLYTLLPAEGASAPSPNYRALRSE
jgi:hypothetical protein